MRVGEVKATTRQWVEANLERWPGLRGAHLVGGITALEDSDEFPAHKDVDLHLVFEDGSAALEPAGPFAPILEEAYEGLLLEAGLKPMSEYASPEVVLANPEIAYHLTRDCVLHDPDGWLRGLQAPVRREYARRRWVRARVEYERRGLDGVRAMVAMASEGWGASGELNLLGYSMTFVAAALQVAALKPPGIGGRLMLRLQQSLREAGRLDLYDEALGILGVDGVSPERAAEILEEGAEAFDLAVQVKRTAHPFQHKLYAHLRPYFVESCREMLDEGHHREALVWITPYHLATTDVILIDAPESERPRFAARGEQLLRDLGFATAEQRAARFARAGRFYADVFALAERIVDTHPDVMD